MVSSTLLRTKLNVPKPPSRLLRRPHLHDRLQSGLEVPLTLVAAPAGFGKTMAIASWARDLDRPVAWVSLDASDADPVQFWTYVLSALEELQPGTGADALMMLQTPQPPPLRAILATLVNSVDALDGEVILVLDDYHHITSAVIHESLAFVLEHPPVRLHIYLSSRSEPPLPLARLRARDQVIEVRAEELRFRPDEISAFLSAIPALNLASEDVAKLAERTEGWIAGLQLAALALPAHADPARFIASFGGSHRHVLSFLSQEVLGAQSPDVQSFLVQTSILSRMCASLCVAVTGQQRAEAILDYLRDAGLFVMPLDPEGTWFRYYHLFADFLRHRLHHLDHEKVPGMRRRAAEWLAAEGLTIEAAEHLFAIPDFVSAAGLIEDVAPALLLGGEVATILRLMEGLPEGEVIARPNLALHQTGAFLYQGRLADAERLLGLVEESLPRESKSQGANAQGEGRAIAGKIASHRAAIAAMRGDGGRTMALAQAALDALPEDSLSDRAGAVLAMGHAHRLTGDAKAAESVYASAARMSFAVGNLPFGAAALFMQAYTLVWQGRLREATGLYRHLIEAADSRGGAARALSGAAYAGLGQVLYEWGDLGGATSAADEAIARGRQWANIRDQVSAFMTIASVCQARGQAQAAMDALERGERLLDEADRSEQSFPWLQPHLAATRARLAVRQGNLYAAQRWSSQRGLSTDGEIPSTLPFPLDFEYLTLARVLLAEGRPDAMSGLLEKLARESGLAGPAGNAIEVSMLCALALQARGETSRALHNLRHAISAASEEGYLRVFVDEGVAMRSLLMRLREQEPRGSEIRAYVEAILAAFEDETVSAREQLPRRIEMEPLTEREREVLGLIAKGLTNKEIARQMVVEVSTVKTHVHNVYGKLGATDRVQAMVRARELGLLEP